MTQKALIGTLALQLDATLNYLFVSSRCINEATRCEANEELNHLWFMFRCAKKIVCLI